MTSVCHIGVGVAKEAASFEPQCPRPSAVHTATTDANADTHLGTWQHNAAGKMSAASVLAKCHAQRVKTGGLSGMREAALQFIKDQQLDDTFYVVDLGSTIRLLKAWRAALPRVVPFYAIKCNPEPVMVKLLLSMGTGFDCASKEELRLALSLGADPSRIIFANPCKKAADIIFARDNHVAMTTFDSESELRKLASLHPSAQCVLRLRADDPDARVKLGLKYGATFEEALALLHTAKHLNLNVMGVSFHVGSGCKNLSAFSYAISKAREVFDAAEKLGFCMSLLDIGGGFTGHFDAHGNVMFSDVAAAINEALATYFPPETHVRFIAEPGRYLAEMSSTLLTPVFGERLRSDEQGVRHDYWITDGLYGSFNCIIYDAQSPEAHVVRSPALPAPGPDADELHRSTVWGPTCDSADVVFNNVMLPELRNGDWLMFQGAGAYTIAGACNFNGINATSPTMLYIVSDSAVDEETGADAGDAK